jgi:hypothetical protein
MAELPERELTGEFESFLRTTRPPDLPDDDDAIDFSLVHADDAFLDALGAAIRHSPESSRANVRVREFEDSSDERLAALLLSWREDVDAEPIGDLVEPKLAVATVQAARARQRRGPRLLAPLAAAAAVLAIAFAGIGLAAQNAQPGDTLWGLARVLYADHARSVEAAQAVRSDLNRAEEALAKGKVAEAKSMLDEARHALPTVANEDGKSDLAAQHQALVDKLPDNPAVGASPPPAASPSTVPGTDTTVANTSPPDPSTTNPPVTTNPTTTTEPPVTTTTESGGGRVETTATAPATAPAKEPNNQPAAGDTNPAVANSDPAGTGS